MHDLILFSQQQPYRSFAERAELVRQRKASAQHPPQLSVRTLQLALGQGSKQAIQQFVRRFQSSLKQFVAEHPQLLAEVLLEEFRKEPFLQEIAEVMESQQTEENRRLLRDLAAQNDEIVHLREELEQHVKRDLTRQHQSQTTTRNNFNAINSEGNIEFARSLYEKARTSTLEQFHSQVNAFFLKDKVKVTGVKQWPHASDSGEQTARTLIQEAIEEVRNTMGKSEPKYSGQYLAAMLQEHFIGRREKFELVCKMLTNETILRHLEDMFEHDGTPCPQPCCMLRSRQKDSASMMHTPKASARYNVKRSSEICYKSDQVTRYMERFRSSMRERNAKEEDIRSISKTNLEQVESLEKFFNKQHSRRKKLEYRERQRMDNTLRDFIKSIK